MWYEGSGTSDRRFLMADERGSIVSATDSAGGTIAINAYDEYGIPAPTNSGRFGYTGQIWLPDLNLWYYKARMYSPTRGRFLQTDPIGYADGMNWYDYVGGDPVNFVDPLGLNKDCNQKGQGASRGTSRGRVILEAIVAIVCWLNGDKPPSRPERIKPPVEYPIPPGPNPNPVPKPKPDDDDTPRPDDKKKKKYLLERFFEMVKINE